jgi:translation initiation factor 2B subunit (eIF-2B alpha/beta/delta family)
MYKKNKLQLQKICSDKISGSAELLDKINSFLLKNHENISDLKEIIAVLQKHFISFQNIYSYLEQFRIIILTKRSPKKYIINYKDKRENIFTQLFNNSLPYLKRKKIFLTISNSKTIIEIFKRFKESDAKLQVYVCESRPKLEGQIFSKQLLKNSINVSLITEAQSAEYAKKCDCILLGADMILRNGDVVNKVGSNLLAILALYYNKPCYIIAEKSKKSQNTSYKQRVESKFEIWRNAPVKVGINNHYFEVIPKALISKIISE